MKQTFGSSLVWRTSGLIFLALALFALGSYRLIVRPTISGLAQAEMGMVSQQVEARIQHLLSTVEVTLRSSRGWGMNGDLNHDQLFRFNEFFFPIIANHPEISSVNFAHESGREILLLQTNEGKWINRLSDPVHWGRKTYWLTWDAARRLEKVEMRELDYDSRKRPWHRGAMALKDPDAIFWTEPYIFFTTKEPGITASTRWTAANGERFVIGHDVKLLDLSRFTSSLQLGERGVAALIREDGSLMALPKDARFKDDASLKAAVLKSAADIGIDAVAHGQTQWQQAHRPVNAVTPYEHLGERWFSLFRPSQVGQRQVWLAVFAPEVEFIPGRAGDILMLLLITAAALATGSLVALRVARRFAAPLADLAQESERIGRLDLSAPVVLHRQDAPWREVTQLAQAQEVMRQRLLEATSSLEDANERLEAKVKERTAALAHQVALVEALLDSMPNPIFYLDPEGRFLGCNQAYEAAFGMRRAAYLGQRLLQLGFLPEQTRLSHQLECDNAIRLASRLTREEKLQYADGHSRDVLYAVTGFHNPDGSPGGLIGILVDVSSLKEAERVAREARAQAEAAAAAKAEFLANMSHEIRTPMNAIIGMTQLTLMTELTPRQRHYLEKVHGAANGLLGLINDILDFSKIEAGKMSCEEAIFPLENVTSHVADMAAIRARDKGLELLLDVAAEVPSHLLGDALRLGQVLTNLVSNAVKFTEKGEVALIVKCLTRTADQAELHFEVRDSGIGMDQAALNRIFSAFSQADSSTTRRYGGTGLGLSISQHLVRLMGGCIQVASEPGKGSRFFFSLTFKLPDQVPATPRTSLARLDIRGMPALVVDDSLAAREVFQNMLQALTFPTRTVATGQEALAELDQAEAAGEPIKLMLIDWKMPGMDGVETLRRVRQDFGPRAPLCLLATAHDRESLAEALGETPVDGILDKPATASSLLDAIVTACGRQPQRLESRSSQGLARIPLAQLRHAFAGRRVLLAEDNETNQELAVELLNNVGLSTVVAADGAQVLQRTAEQNFDLVLMDCQMPIMDGLEATRRLRAEPRHADLPIVAMTANAMVGEREKCLDAGMSDYLAKPIDVAVFYATLARWLAPQLETADTPDTEAPTEATVTAPTIVAASTSLQQLDRATALQRMGGDENLYRHLLSRFRERESQAPELFLAAWQAGDKEAARRIVHNLKGLAANIGAEALAVASRHLEYHLDGHDADREQALEHWQWQLKQLLDRLARDEQAPQPEASAGPVDRLAIEALIRTLLAQLSDDDAKANRNAAELARLLGDTPQAESAQTLARHAARYDYDQALDQLQALAQALAISV